eukprot:Cvel_24423.t1-p1 / transcript=Cvel_24423.t1 / gene=Cvel_24423 / organism=Chromera_velia_CCMP2878 / gene_product=hypothetical protein / transcript_product=hypothetical protein / location=Cvel_scaffold2637:4884-24618(+) / protein_length=4107 / sequence_SO=supercontig / SO=protein_coding / is_pseudo=false
MLGERVETALKQLEGGKLKEQRDALGALCTVVTSVKTSVLNIDVSENEFLTYREILKGVVEYLSNELKRVMKPTNAAHSDSARDLAGLISGILSRKGPSIVPHPLSSFAEKIQSHILQVLCSTSESFKKPRGQWVSMYLRALHQLLTDRHSAASMTFEQMKGLVKVLVPRCPPSGASPLVPLPEALPEENTGGGVHPLSLGGGGRRFLVVMERPLSARVPLGWQPEWTSSCPHPQAGGLLHSLNGECGAAIRERVCLAVAAAVLGWRMKGQIGPQTIVSQVLEGLLGAVMDFGLTEERPLVYLERMMHHPGSLLFVSAQVNDLCVGFLRTLMALFRERRERGYGFRLPPCVGRGLLYKALFALRCVLPKDIENGLSKREEAGASPEVVREMDRLASWQVSDCVLLRLSSASVSPLPLLRLVVFCRMCEKNAASVMAGLDEDEDALEDTGEKERLRAAEGADRSGVSRGLLNTAMVLRRLCESLREAAGTATGQSEVREAPLKGLVGVSPAVGGLLVALYGVSLALLSRQMRQGEKGGGRVRADFVVSLEQSALESPDQPVVCALRCDLSEESIPPVRSAEVVRELSSLLEVVAGLSGGRGGGAETRSWRGGLPSPPVPLCLQMRVLHLLLVLLPREAVSPSTIAPILPLCTGADEESRDGGPSFQGAWGGRGSSMWNNVGRDSASATSLFLWRLQLSGVVIQRHDGTSLPQFVRDLTRAVLHSVVAAGSSDHKATGGGWMHQIDPRISAMLGSLLLRLFGSSTSPCGDPVRWIESRPQRLEEVVFSLRPSFLLDLCHLHPSFKGSSRASKGGMGGGAKTRGGVVPLTLWGVSAQTTGNAEFSDFGQWMAEAADDTGRSNAAGLEGRLVSVRNLAEGRPLPLAPVFRSSICLKQQTKTTLTPLPEVHMEILRALCSAGEDVIRFFLFPAEQLEVSAGYNGQGNAAVASLGSSPALLPPHTLAYLRLTSSDCPFRCLSIENLPSFVNSATSFLSLLSLALRQTDPQLFLWPLEGHGGRPRGMPPTAGGRTVREPRCVIWLALCLAVQQLARSVAAEVDGGRCFSSDSRPSSPREMGEGTESGSGAVRTRMAEAAEAGRLEAELEGKAGCLWASLCDVLSSAVVSGLPLCEKVCVCRGRRPRHSSWMQEEPNPMSCVQRERRRMPFDQNGGGRNEEEGGCLLGLLLGDGGEPASSSSSYRQEGPERLAGLSRFPPLGRALADLFESLAKGRALHAEEAVLAREGAGEDEGQQREPFGFPGVQKKILSQSSVDNFMTLSPDLRAAANKRKRNDENDRSPSQGLAGFFDDDSLFGDEDEERKGSDKKSRVEANGKKGDGEERGATEHLKSEEGIGGERGSKGLFWSPRGNGGKTGLQTDACFERRLAACLSPPPSMALRLLLQTSFVSPVSTADIRGGGVEGQDTGVGGWSAGEAKVSHETLCRQLENVMLCGLSVEDLGDLPPGLVTRGGEGGVGRKSGARRASRRMSGMGMGTSGGMCCLSPVSVICGESLLVLLEEGCAERARERRGADGSQMGLERSRRSGWKWLAEVVFGAGLRLAHAYTVGAGGALRSGVNRGLSFVSRLHMSLWRLIVGFVEEGDRGGGEQSEAFVEFISHRTLWGALGVMSSALVGWLRFVFLCADETEVLEVGEREECLAWEIAVRAVRCLSRGGEKGKVVKGCEDTVREIEELLLGRKKGEEMEEEGETEMTFVEWVLRDEWKSLEVRMHASSFIVPPFLRWAEEEADRSRQRGVSTRDTVGGLALKGAHSLLQNAMKALEYRPSMRDPSSVTAETADLVSVSVSEPDIHRLRAMETANQQGGGARAAGIAFTCGFTQMDAEQHVSATQSAFPAVDVLRGNRPASRPASPCRSILMGFTGLPRPALYPAFAMLSDSASVTMCERTRGACLVALVCLLRPCFVPLKGSEGGEGTGLEDPEEGSTPTLRLSLCHAFENRESGGFYAGVEGALRRIGERVHQPIWALLQPLRNSCLCAWMTALLREKGARLNAEEIELSLQAFPCSLFLPPGHHRSQKEESEETGEERRARFFASEFAGTLFASLQAAASFARKPALVSILRMSAGLPVGTSEDEKNRRLSHELLRQASPYLASLLAIDAVLSRDPSGGDAADDAREWRDTQVTLLFQKDKMKRAVSTDDVTVLSVLLDLSEADPTDSLSLLLREEGRGNTNNVHMTLQRSENWGLADGARAENFARRVRLSLGMFEDKALSSLGFVSLPAFLTSRLGLVLHLLTEKCGDGTRDETLAAELMRLMGEGSRLLAVFDVCNTHSMKVWALRLLLFFSLRLALQFEREGRWRASAVLSRLIRAVHERAGTPAVAEAARSVPECPAVPSVALTLGMTLIERECVAGDPNDSCGSLPSVVTNCRAGERGENQLKSRELEQSPVLTLADCLVKACAEHPAGKRQAGTRRRAGGTGEREGGGDSCLLSVLGDDFGPLLSLAAAIPSLSSDVAEGSGEAVKRSSWFLSGLQKSLCGAVGGGENGKAGRQDGSLSSDCRLTAEEMIGPNALAALFRRAFVSGPVSLQAHGQKGGSLALFRLLLVRLAVRAEVQVQAGVCPTHGGNQIDGDKTQFPQRDSGPSGFSAVSFGGSEESRLASFLRFCDIPIECVALSLLESCERRRSRHRGGDESGLLPARLLCAFGLPSSLQNSVAVFGDEGGAPSPLNPSLACTNGLFEAALPTFLLQQAHQSNRAGRAKDTGSSRTAPLLSLSHNLLAPLLTAQALIVSRRIAIEGSEPVTAKTAWKVWTSLLSAGDAVDTFLNACVNLVSPPRGRRTQEASQGSVWGEELERVRSEAAALASDMTSFDASSDPAFEEAEGKRRKRASLQGGRSASWNGLLKVIQASFQGSGCTGDWRDAESEGTHLCAFVAALGEGLCSSCDDSFDVLAKVVWILCPLLRESPEAAEAFLPWIILAHALGPSDVSSRVGMILSTEIFNLHGGDSLGTCGRERTEEGKKQMLAKSALVGPVVDALAVARRVLTLCSRGFAVPSGFLCLPDPPSGSAEGGALVPVGGGSSRAPASVEDPEPSRPFWNALDWSAVAVGAEASGRTAEALFWAELSCLRKDSEAVPETALKLSRVDSTVDFSVSSALPPAELRQVISLQRELLAGCGDPLHGSLSRWAHPSVRLEEAAADRDFQRVLQLTNRIILDEADRRIGGGGVRGLQNPAGGGGSIRFCVSDTLQHLGLMSLQRAVLQQPNGQGDGEAPDELGWLERRAENAWRLGLWADEGVPVTGMRGQVKENGQNSPTEKSIKTTTDSSACVGFHSHVFQSLRSVRLALESGNERRFDAMRVHQQTANERAKDAFDAALKTVKLPAPPAVLLKSLVRIHMAGRLLSREAAGRTQKPEAVRSPTGQHGGKEVDNPFALFESLVLESRGGVESEKGLSGVKVPHSDELEEIAEPLSALLRVQQRLGGSSADRGDHLHAAPFAVAPEGGIPVWLDALRSIRESREVRLHGMKESGVNVLEGALRRQESQSDLHLRRGGGSTEEGNRFSRLLETNDTRGVGGVDGDGSLSLPSLASVALRWEYARALREVGGRDRARALFLGRSVADAVLPLVRGGQRRLSAGAPQREDTGRASFSSGPSLSPSSGLLFSEILSVVGGWILEDAADEPGPTLHKYMKASVTAVPPQRRASALSRYGEFADRHACRLWDLLDTRQEVAAQLQEAQEKIRKLEKERKGEGNRLLLETARREAYKHSKLLQSESVPLEKAKAQAGEFSLEALTSFAHALTYKKLPDAPRVASRFLSLWFTHGEREGEDASLSTGTGRGRDSNATSGGRKRFNEGVAAALDRISLEHILPLIYQVASRLETLGEGGNRGGDVNGQRRAAPQLGQRGGGAAAARGGMCEGPPLQSFASLLEHLLLRMVLQYPFQAAYPLLSLERTRATAAKDSAVAGEGDKNPFSKKGGAGNHRNAGGAPSSPLTLQSPAARVLSEACRLSPEIAELLARMKDLCELYAEVARFECNRTEKASFNLSSVKKFQQMRGQASWSILPVPTDSDPAVVPLENLLSSPTLSSLERGEREGDASRLQRLPERIPCICRFEDEIRVTDSGLAQPKVLRLVDSRGEVHKQICKANDDLRQDAVWQQ